MGILTKRSPAVVSNVELPPRRYPEKTALELQFETTKRLIQSSGLSPGDIDGLLSAPAGLGTSGKSWHQTHEDLYDELGIHPRYSATVMAGGATFGIMMYKAALAISSGEVDSVLCVGAGKYENVSELGEEQASQLLNLEWDFPYGAAFIPALYALPTRWYMNKYGGTKEDFARVSVSQRKWATRHDQAMMKEKGTITVQDVLDSPPIAQPFHRLHCSVPTEGGGAYLMTAGERAEEFTDQPAYLHGYGEYHSHKTISKAHREMTKPIRLSSELAYESAGLGPEAIDAAMLYDAFASTPLIALEETQLAPRGEGGNFYRDGCADPGGELPINTYGGLISYGHTGDSSGMSLVNEAITQTLGQAGERQVPGLDFTLAHTWGGSMAEHVTLILGREPA